MSKDRINAALDRIDRALARIETEAALVQHAPPAGAATTESDGDLAARHEALRGQVAASLAELDALIGEIEG